MTNKSVTKAVPLLRELAAQPRPGATVTTLAKAVGISRPTAFRLLYSLERTRLVDRIDNNYLLGWELTRLGRLADPYAELVARAQPYYRSSPTNSTSQRPCRCRMRTTASTSSPKPSART